MSVPERQRLTHLGVLRVSGPDARSFLQGQLSCDLQKLSATQALLGSVNSAQGRVQAILTLVTDGEDVLLLAPQELQTALIARLRPFILRAKVQLADAGTQFDLSTAVDDDAKPAAPAAASPTMIAPGSVHSGSEGISVRWWGSSGLQLHLSAAKDRGDSAADAAQPTQADQYWRAACIAAGVPQVWRATSGSFVAQMLNLEILGGISFHKGCYTGQEIIARAHYRGAVKRRMFRFHSFAPAPAPGERLLHAAAGAGEVVDAVPIAGGSELLAVVSLAELDQPLTLADGTPLERLPLPYPVPVPAA